MADYLRDELGKLLDRHDERRQATLAREHPDCYVQSHLSENHEEIRTVRRLFPAAESYTEVYARYGLLGPRSIFGHCLYLDEAESEKLLSDLVEFACHEGNYGMRGILSATREEERRAKEAGR